MSRPKTPKPLATPIGELTVREIRPSDDDTIELVADLNEGALRHLAAQGIRAMMYQGAVTELATRSPSEALRLMIEFFGNPHGPQHWLAAQAEPPASA